MTKSSQGRRLSWANTGANTPHEYVDDTPSRLVPHELELDGETYTVKLYENTMYGGRRDMRLGRDLDPENPGIYVHGYWQKQSGSWMIDELSLCAECDCYWHRPHDDLTQYLCPDCRRGISS